MTIPYQRLQRALAIDPSVRGFGWAVLEGTDLLVDWGVCQLRTKQPERALGRVAALIHRFAPHVIVIEDIRDSSCRRRERARAFITEIAAMAHASEIAVVRVARIAVRTHYTELGARNKDAVARGIVERFPELEPILPPRRKNWMREDERMAVFDAIAMVLTNCADEV